MLVAANRTRAAQPSQLRHDDIRNPPITHSGRLVYARPQDLPSFPSIGLAVSAAAAATAATTAAALGWANKKSPEPGRSSNSTCVPTAAAMAEENSSARVQQDSVSSSHVTNAALLAAQSATSHSTSKPASSDEGITAATQALRLNRTGTLNTSSVGLERHGSLVAAKGAVARRLRAESMPIPKQHCLDEVQAAADALSAATRAHRPVTSPVSLEDVGAVPYTTMDRQMFTSQPPVQSEVDEKKRAEMLHASAVAMAKKMYTQQQMMIEARKSDVARTSQRQRDDIEISSSISDDPQPAQLTTLQDAAYKQAQARLAKMQLENDQNMNHRGYHGANPLSRHFSIKEKFRKRSSSDGALFEDKKRSQEIRKQMSLFSNRLSEVHAQNRPYDQQMLLAAAQRNVHEQLKEMDQKIAAETGMVPPGTLSQWELKARSLAPSRTLRKEAHQQGKVNIGAGINMDREDINIIAARRIQPVLDEINAKTNIEHARDTEMQLDKAREKEKQEAERVRLKEAHDSQKTLKHREKLEQKGRRAEEKQNAKMKKEEQKAAKADRKRAVLEKAKSTEYEQRGLVPEESIITMNSSGQPVKVPRPGTQETRTSISAEKSRDGPKSPPGRLYSWFKSRFSRKSKSPDEEQSEGQPSQRGFIGGASLTGYQDNKSSTSVDNRSASMRAVALAGKYPSSLLSRPEGGTGTVSPLDSDSDNDFFRYGIGARTVFTPPRPIRTSSPAHSQGSVRDSRFHEDI
ncbi:hypothetical protein GGS21DRAFT_497562 [Xylaria nigripes]|nr:hypothetical protein GGS21DRAFT_497562 [Xylaria nigripes]